MQSTFISVWIRKEKTDEIFFFSLYKSKRVKVRDTTSRDTAASRFSPCRGRLIYHHRKWLVSSPRPVLAPDFRIIPGDKLVQKKKKRDG